MRRTAIQLIGGPLDGIFLPMTAGARTPPKQLLVYCPNNTTWCNYVDRKRKTGATDVYRLRHGLAFTTSAPQGLKIVSLAYVGPLSPEAVQCIKDAERERGLEEDCDD